MAVDGAFFTALTFFRRTFPEGFFTLAALLLIAGETFFALTVFAGLTILPDFCFVVLFFANALAINIL